MKRFILKNSIFSIFLTFCILATASAEVMFMENETDEASQDYKKAYNKKETMQSIIICLKYILFKTPSCIFNGSNSGALFFLFQFSFFFEAFLCFFLFLCFPFVSTFGHQNLRLNCFR